MILKKKEAKRRESDAFVQVSFLISYRNWLVVAPLHHHCSLCVNVISVNLCWRMVRVYPRGRICTVTWPMVEAIFSLVELSLAHFLLCNLTIWHMDRKSTTWMSNEWFQWNLFCISMIKYQMAIISVWLLKLSFVFDINIIFQVRKNNWRCPVFYDWHRKTSVC